MATHLLPRPFDGRMRWVPDPPWKAAPVLMQLSIESPLNASIPEPINRITEPFLRG